MNRTIASFLALLTATAAFADWLTTPAYVTYTPPVDALTFTATGVVTVIPAAPALRQRALTSIAASAVLPAGDTATASFAWSLADGSGETNTLASLTNQQSAAFAPDTWLGPEHILLITLEASVTSRPSWQATCLTSPAVTNIITLYDYDQWILRDLRPLVTLLPDEPSNTLAVAADFYGSALSQELASFTNAAPSWSGQLYLFPGDSLRVTATRITNTVPLRAATERQRP